MNWPEAGDRPPPQRIRASDDTVDRPRSCERGSVVVFPNERMASHGVKRRKRRIFGNIVELFWGGLEFKNENVSLALIDDWPRGASAAIHWYRVRHQRIPPFGEIASLKNG